eukprot:7187302-Lingulodinium_polyedra.AAC.1
MGLYAVLYDKLYSDPAVESRLGSTLKYAMGSYKMFATPRWPLLESTMDYGGVCNPQWPLLESTTCYIGVCKGSIVGSATKL